MTPSMQWMIRIPADFARPEFSELISILQHYQNV
jgi:hypothetical protein